MSQSIRGVQFSVQDRTGPVLFGPVFCPDFCQIRSSVRSGGLDRWTEFEQNFFFWERRRHEQTVPHCWPRLKVGNSVLMPKKKLWGKRQHDRVIGHGQTVPHCCPAERKGTVLIGPGISQYGPVLGPPPTPNSVFGLGRSWTDAHPYNQLRYIVVHVCM